LFRKSLRLFLFILLSFVFIISTCKDSVSSPVIQAQIDNGVWSQTKAVYPLAGQKISLKVEKVPAAHIRWYQIIPDVAKIYQNANFPWGKDPYKWIGFAKIRYLKKELKEFRDRWLINPLFTGRPIRSKYFHGGIGSFWIQAEVEKDKKVIKTPGIEDSDHRGLSPKVFRVSIRKNDEFLGYLTSFYNVPGLFGSVPYQSNNYIGADCADVLMAAYYKWRKKSSKKDYNVAMLVRKFPHVTEFDLRGGIPVRKINWGRNIREGDLIAVRYKNSRQYQHIGALYKDANKNGILDEQDTVLHAGPHPLHLSTLEEGGFDGHVVILRLPSI